MITGRDVCNHALYDRATIRVLNFNKHYLLFNRTIEATKTIIG